MYLIIDSPYIDTKLETIIYNYPILKERYKNLQLIEKSHFLTLPDHENAEILDLKLKGRYNMNRLLVLNILKHIDYILFYIYLVREIINFQNEYFYKQSELEKMFNVYEQVDIEFQYEDLIKLFKIKEDFPIYVDIDLIPKDHILYVFTHNIIPGWKIYNYIKNNIIINYELFNFIIGSYNYFRKERIENELLELKNTLVIDNNLKTYILDFDYKSHNLGEFLFSNEYEFITPSQLDKLEKEKSNLIMVDSISITGDYLNDLLKPYKEYTNIYFLVPFITTISIENLKDINIINNLCYSTIQERIIKYRFNYLLPFIDDIDFPCFYCDYFYNFSNKHIDINYKHNSLYDLLFYFFGNVTNQVVVFDYDETLVNEENQIRPYAKELINFLERERVKLCVFTYRPKKYCDETFYDNVDRLFTQLKQGIPVYTYENTLNGKKNLDVIYNLFNIDNIIIIDDKNHLIDLGNNILNSRHHIYIPEFNKKSKNDNVFLKILNHFEKYKFENLNLLTYDYFLADNL